MFQLMPVLQIVKMCEAEEWFVSSRIAEFTKKRFSAIMQSKIVEDGFHTERTAQDAQPDLQLTPKRAWESVLNDTLIDETHRFKKVPRIAGAKRGESQSEYPTSRPLFTISVFH